MILHINDIIIPQERLRYLDDVKVREIAESIKNIGQINPIIVANKQLVAGLHRYFACKALGIEYPLVAPMGSDAKMLDEQDNLALIEIDENLFRNELTENERNHHIMVRADIIARRKLYEELGEDDISKLKKEKAYSGYVKRANKAAIDSLANVLKIKPATVKKRIGIAKKLDDAGIVNEHRNKLNAKQLEDIAKFAKEPQKAANVAKELAERPYHKRHQESAAKVANDSSHVIRRGQNLGHQASTTKRFLTEFYKGSEGELKRLLEAADNIAGALSEIVAEHKAKQDVQ
ncbi:hypothetical protein D1115_16215 [Vibrio alfacsensis]|uniref:ParB-like N-terminal domain-containing protein n=2 Tax=Vibrio alfacsensis TaxID=1074311 RepID=A0ABM6YYB3_9VIBR|nr:hypothetical protein D1115_16215 [Vibrio alfacsensis]